MLDTLRDCAGTLTGPPGVWVVAPVAGFMTHPSIDGVPIPIIGSHQTLWQVRQWVSPRMPRVGAALLKARKGTYRPTIGAHEFRKRIFNQCLQPLMSTLQCYCKFVNRSQCRPPYPA